MRHRLRAVTQVARQQCRETTWAGSGAWQLSVVAPPAAAHRKKMSSDATSCARSCKLSSSTSEDTTTTASSRCHLQAQRCPAASPEPHALQWHHAGERQARRQAAQAPKLLLAPSAHAPSEVGKAKHRQARQQLRGEQAQNGDAGPPQRVLRRVHCGAQRGRQSLARQRQTAQPRGSRRGSTGAPAWGTCSWQA
jgi:hypothetical protein